MARLSHGTQNMLTRLSLALVALIALSGPTLAQGFDSRPEGSAGLFPVEDQVLFSQLDPYLPVADLPFYFDDVSVTLAGMPNFTPPMALGFSSYIPGPDGPPGRLGKVRLNAFGPRDYAQFDAYVDRGSSGGNTLTLEVWSGGTLLSTDVRNVLAGTGMQHIPFSYSGNLFDVLWLVSAGPVNGGATYTLLDNVELGLTTVGPDLCFGDGNGNACPCGNFSTGPRGCRNSTGEGGFLFAQSGVESYEFNVVDIPPLAPVLLFHGSITIGSGGNGLGFGDGLRCVGLGVQRLGVARANEQGAASWDPIPNSPGPNIRYAQAWYRDSHGAAPCGSGFNLTQAVPIAWGN